MDWAFVRREWGAVTFVLTVLVGLVVVPIALYFGNQSPSAASAAESTAPTISASPTSSPLASPTPAPTSTPSPAASPTKTP